MTNTGLNVIDNYSVRDFLDLSPRELSMLGEHASATLPKDKYEFFNFDEAEKYYSPAQIAKTIEQKAKSGEINVPFNFDKFKLDTNNNYDLMYQALKRFPEYRWNKDKQRVGRLLEQKIRDKAKQGLQEGVIDRSEFDRIYRFARFANPKFAGKAVEPNKVVEATSETLVGMMQTAAGMIKTGTDVVNSLGADIDTTGLDALITHYDMAVRRYQHILGEENNAILNFQNLGDLVLGFGVLGKTWKATKYTAGVGERFKDYLINGAVASGLGYVTAVGRNDKNPEDAAVFGLVGGIAMSSALHNLHKLGLSSYEKVEQALVDTLQLSDDDINKAVNSYAKYMDIDDITSPKTKVEAILTHYGADLKSIIAKSGNETGRDLVDLKRFIDARKNYLIDYLDKNNLDLDDLSSKLNEANILAQHLWDKVTYNIGQQLVDLPENIVKKDLIDAPLDALDDITKTKVARIKEIIQKPTIEGLMEADKVINEIKRGLKNNKAKYREWSEFQQRLNDTLREVMPEKAYNEWIELKGIYAKIAQARDSRIGKILKLDTTPEAKLQKLSRLQLDSKDFRALANLVGEEEVAKLEKAIIKEAIGDLGNKKTWRSLNYNIRNKGFVTEEGKTLQKFVDDMSKYFKLDDELNSIQHAFERSAGFREDIWGALRANIIGRIGLKLSSFIIDMFRTKEDRLDNILYTYLNDVYKNPSKVKEFNIKLQNMDETLLDKLRQEAVKDAMDEFEQEFAKGNYYNKTHDIVVDGNANVKKELPYYRDNNGNDFPFDPTNPPFNPTNPPLLPNSKPPLLPNKGGDALSPTNKLPLNVQSDLKNVLSHIVDYVREIGKELNVPEEDISKGITALQGYVTSKISNAYKYFLTYNETLPSVIDKLKKALTGKELDKLSKEIFGKINDDNISVMEDIMNYIVNTVKTNLYYATSSHIPAKLDEYTYKILLSNPEQELEYLKKYNTYIDLFGIPKEIVSKKYYKSFNDEFTKKIRVINNKTDGAKLKINIDKNIEYSNLSYNKDTNTYTINIKSSKDLPTVVHEYQHYLQQRFKDLFDDEILSKVDLWRGGTPQEIGAQNYHNLIGEIEARMAQIGFQEHPIIDMLNNYRLEVRDRFYNKDGVSKPEPIFNKKLKDMYPLFEDIDNGKIETKHLPEIRRYIALRYRNPSYVSNPYVAEMYGVRVNWEAIDPKKLAKYKRVFEEGKHFKVLPTLLAGSGLVIANNINNKQNNTITFANFIKQNEGVRLLPYKDIYGNWTIGYGHKIKSKEELQKYMNGISQIEAEELFRKDLGWVTSRIKKLYPYFDSLPEQAKLVLQDMAFNLGINGLSKFKKLKEAINKRDFKTASKEILNSKYAQQLPSRASKNASLLMSIG